MGARTTTAMLAAIRNFFDRHIAGPAEEAPLGAQKRAQMAAAALLVEVTRTDDTITEEERRAVLDSVQRKFELGPERARELFELAEVQARDAHDLHQFTSKINASFDPGQKVRLIEELWRAAFADGRLNEHEEHLIRRVADLLHVPHAAFIGAKLRVLDTRSQV